MTLDQGHDQSHDTTLGPVQQFCEILLHIINSVKSYSSDNVKKVWKTKKFLNSKARNSGKNQWITPKRELEL